MRHEVAPILSAGCRQRRPGDLEVLRTVGIGADDQGRPAVEVRMMFDFILDAGLARRDKGRQHVRRGEIEEPDLGRLVVVRRDVTEAVRSVAAD